MFLGLKNTVYRVMWLGLLCLLAAGLLAACDSEPSPDVVAPAGNAPAASGEAPAASAPAAEPTAVAQTATATPTPTPRPIATPTVTPLPPADTPAPAPTATPPDGEPGIGYYAIAPDVLMGDLFDTFTESEQDCARDELDDELLATLLEQPVFSDDNDTEEWQLTIMKCIAPEKTSGIFYSFLVADLGEMVELTGEDKECIRELVDKSDVALIISTQLEDAPPEAEIAAFAFAFGLLVCVPELATAGPSSRSNPGAPEAPVVWEEGQLWSFAVDGWVSTAPTVSDGVVYVGSEDFGVYALDVATGERLWSFATGGIIRVPTVLADGVVYVGSDDRSLYALDAATGELRWSFATGDVIRAAPTIADGVVYLGSTDRNLYVLDAVSGAQLWVVELPYPFNSDFTPSAASGRVYAPGLDLTTFRSLDAATGEQVWIFDTGAVGVQSAAIVAEGVVYFSEADNAYALDELNGEPIWSYHAGDLPATGFPAVVAEGVYYFAPGDNLYALDAGTGELHWSYQSYNINTRLLVADGKVFAGSGAEYIFALDAATGEELWRLDTADSRLFAFSVSDGILYAESESGYLTAIDTTDGFPIWNYDKGNTRDSRAYTVSDGVVYLGTVDRQVNAFAAPEG